MDNYDEIFARRGSAYDDAMQAYPEARAKEFAQIINALAPAPGDRIGDVPAGGGYLRRYLPESCTWSGHEPCGDFLAHSGMARGAGDVPLLPLPFGDAALDGIVSLAGVHHIDDKRALFDEAHRVTRPGGRFVLSDVRENSPVAQFLDDFVGQWNSTGHEGTYLTEATVETMEAAGWQVEDASINRFTWDFATREDMAQFSKSLFDISKLERPAVATAIEERLGVIDRSDGSVGMCWELMTVTAIRPLH